MVSAAKLRGAQTALDISREFVKGVTGVWDLKEEENKEKNTKLYIALASDKGLCGAVNSSISRGIRDKILALGKDYPKDNIKLVTLGDKGKQGLDRLFGRHMVFSFSELAKSGRINWNAVCMTTESVLSTEFDEGYLAYNKFRSLLSYDTTYTRFAPFDKAQEDRSSLELYELEGEGDMLQNFYEFQFAVKLFGAFRESEASELSSRMNAMGNSSKNAGEMLEALTLLYNRNRQARITTELIEIISGAVALDDAE